MVGPRREIAIRELIEAAYWTLLGRGPENAAVVDQHVASGDARTVLSGIVTSAEFRQRNAGSPFDHYAATFDAIGTLHRHARSDLRPHPGYLTNFLGVLIDPKFFPSILEGRQGVVEAPPIPSNWHADIAEWAAALRAVDLSGSRFVVAELGCGWGCWLNNTGVAARQAGKDVQLIGVEGDAGHVAFAHEACATNRFRPDQVRIETGIAAARSGVALFPKQDRPGGSWGLEPLFDLSDNERAARLQGGAYDEMRMFSLDQLLDGEARVDLLHIDIQGGEADLVEASSAVLNQRVAFLFVGTHSRQIEGRLWRALMDQGWILEVERPAIFSLHDEGPILRVDGSYGWRNPRLDLR